MEKIINNKKILPILVMFVVISTFFGGTLAYWIWESNESQRTNLGFMLETIGSGFECYADGGGAIDSTSVNVMPATCTNINNAIIREVTVTVDITKTDMPIDLELSLNVNHLDTELSNSENLRYSLTTSDSSCDSDKILSGSFNGKIVGNQVKILEKSYTESTTETYYLYIWLDNEETNPETAGKSFEFELSGSCTNNPDVYISPEKPVLDAGMIPVTISADGVVTTVSKDDSSWYNYENKEWANVVLVKESGTQTRSYYKNNTGKTVAEDDILAYYVWIPRYSYAFPKADGNPEEISIIFELADAEITTGTATGDSYYTHPAFIWDGSTVAGIWVGKFETGHSSLSSSTTANNLGCTNDNCANADGLIIKPNVKSLRYNKVSNFFYASSSMTRSSNPFGLSSSTTDSHMMKNSEWGAVAYLSHSKYGINQEIYINNSSGYYTGRSAGGVGSDNTEISTNGTYTWTGQEIDSSGTIGSYASDRTLGTNASTTGNVTGVYDMSGGAGEYAMGNYGKTKGSGGFTTLPDSKYYDLYPSTQFKGDSVTNMSLCTLETCGGHALNETANWYLDNANFGYSGYPWFGRGGRYSNGSTAGAFYSNYGSGSSLSTVSFRSVLVYRG